MESSSCLYSTDLTQIEIIQLFSCRLLTTLFRQLNLQQSSDLFPLPGRGAVIAPAHCLRWLLPNAAIPLHYSGGRIGLGLCGGVIPDPDIGTGTKISEVKGSVSIEQGIGVCTNMHSHGSRNDSISPVGTHTDLIFFDRRHESMNRGRRGLGPRAICIHQPSPQAEARLLSFRQVSFCTHAYKNLSIGSKTCSAKIEVTFFACNLVK